MALSLTQLSADYAKSLVIIKLSFKTGSYWLVLFGIGEDDSVVVTLIGVLRPHITASLSSSAVRLFMLS